MKPVEFRHQVREGRFSGPTAGHCGAYAQANLVILPRMHADDFLRFCLFNPRSCPLLGVSEPGQWTLGALGEDLDLRTDVPGYWVYREGERAEELRSLVPVWRPDFVTFAIGCSFSFEQMLLQEGIPLRHLQERKNVPMFRTRVKNRPAGPFAGEQVVSMRPMKPADAIRAIQITSRFPAIHGAPVHFGDPAALGIGDLQAPDYGDAVSIGPDEVPVFWACGVTPQCALRGAGLPLAITHKPGHMLVTDLPNATLAVF